MGRLFNEEDKVNHYAALGVPQDASMLEIKAAFRAIAQECHPDRTTDADKAERFMAASAAYDQLYHPMQRALYDKRLALENPNTCPRCAGTGVVQKQRGFTGRYTVPCPACNQ